MLDNSICIAVITAVMVSACLFLTIGKGWKNFKTYEKRVKNA